MPKSPHSWSLADAKARLSSVVDRALDSGPQLITRRGQPAVVVVSARQWNRVRVPPGRLSEFLARSPLRNLGLDLDRLDDEPRPLEL